MASSEKTTRGRVAKQLDWEVVARERMHPTQLAVLDHLTKVAETASPKELALVLNEPLGNVAYHVTELRDSGLVEVHRTEPRRGAVEHFYSLALKAVV